MNCLMLQNYYRVDPIHQDHADRVLNQAAKKICKDLFSNIRLQVTNAWLKHQGRQLGGFRDSSDTYLTAEEYQSVMKFRKYVVMSQILWMLLWHTNLCICRSHIHYLKISQALTRHFVIYGLLQVFRSDHESIGIKGPSRQRISLEATDTVESLNAM